MKIDLNWIETCLEKAQNNLNDFYRIFTDKKRCQLSKDIEYSNKEINKISMTNTEEQVVKRNELINLKNSKWEEYNTHYALIFKDLNKKKPQIFHTSNENRVFIDICSPLEYAFALILEILQIGYKCQYKFDRDFGKYDFFIPSFNLLIELDGKENHRSIKKKDYSKGRETQKRGYYFFRYVASDIYKDDGVNPPIFIRLVVKTIVDDFLDLMMNSKVENLLTLINLKEISDLHNEV